MPGLLLPKLPDRLPRNVLTLSEARRVLTAARHANAQGHPRPGHPRNVLLDGHAPGEMAALTVHDVDPQNGFVRVNKGKGGKDRVVPMGRTACRYVREYLREVRAEMGRGQNREERALWLASFKPHRPITETNDRWYDARSYGKAGRAGQAAHAARLAAHVRHAPGRQRRERRLRAAAARTSPLGNHADLHPRDHPRNQSNLSAIRPRLKNTVAPAPAPTRFLPPCHYKGKHGRPRLRPPRRPHLNRRTLTAYEH